MKGIRLALAIVIVFGVVAAAPTAAASHKCYTIGDYPVCRYIPGDEYLEEVFRIVFGCDRPC